MSQPGTTGTPTPPAALLATQPHRAHYIFCVALVSSATLLLAREDAQLTKPELLEPLQTVNAVVSAVREKQQSETQCVH